MKLVWRKVYNNVDLNVLEFFYFFLGGLELIVLFSISMCGGLKCYDIIEKIFFYWEKVCVVRLGLIFCC